MPEAAVVKKPWAVLAYTIAEDAHAESVLDATAKDELTALTDAADFRKVSVAAQVDFRGRRGVYRGALTQLGPKGRDFEPVDPERYGLWAEVKRSVEAKTATFQVAREARDLNATDVDVLEDFLRYGRLQCPADRYFVSFFGHAAGPLGLFDDRTPGTPARTTMRLPALVRAFKGAGSRADVVLFRDCFMNCLEAAYQLRHSTSFVVATQALAPAVGAWPWKRLLAPLARDASPRQVAEGVAKAVARHLDEAKHREGMEAVPYSLLDLSAADVVAAALTDVTNAILAARADAARRRACARALELSRVGAPQRGSLPGDPALLDVPTLCAKLGALTGDPVALAAQRLDAAVRPGLVAWHHSQTPHHQGTALFYAPVRSDDLDASYLFTTHEPMASDDAAEYRALALSKATGWHRIAFDPLPLDD